MSRFGFRATWLSLLLIISSSAVVFGQDLSQRQEIAVFSLSYHGQPPPRSPSADVTVQIRGPRGSLTVSLRGTGNPEYDRLYTRALSAVDQQIRGVFVNLGRFQVTQMPQRLTAGSVDDLVAAVTDYREGGWELPEAVLLGQEVFTEADFRRLTGDFVAVVPSVSWYELVRNDDGSHSARIETSFTFVKAETLETFEQFTVATTGYSERAEGAVRDAVDAIAPELSYRVRSVPEFQIRTGILEVDGSQVILELGSNMGIVPGEEYAIVSDRVTTGGYISTRQTGLIVIQEVQREFSVGRVLYANPRPSPGDQLQEVPRRGVDLQLYLNSLTNGLDSITYLVGVKAMASRGFYDFRPLLAVEYPLRGLVANAFLPLNLQFGGEWNLYLGRLRLTPSLALGVAGAVPLVDDENLESFYLSHFGIVGKVTGSILVSRDVMVLVELGLGTWRSLYGGDIQSIENALSSYGGLLIGGGVTLK